MTMEAPKTAQRATNATNGDPETQETITKKCIQSLNDNSSLRNSLKRGSDAEQRNVLAAWFAGFVSANPTVTATLDVDSFIRESLPEVRKIAA